MLPKELLLGKYLNDVRTIKSMDELLNKYKLAAHSHTRNDQGGMEVHHFVIEKNIWGPVTNLTLSILDKKVYMLGIHSKKNKEYRRLLEELKSDPNTYYFAYKDDGFTYVEMDQSPYLIGYAANVQQKNDTIIALRWNDRFDYNL